LAGFLRNILACAALLADGQPASAGDAAQGEKDFSRCRACHSIESPDETFVRGGRGGPNLYGIVGRQAGTDPDYRYEGSIIEAGEAGLTWTEELIAAYITDPRGFIAGYVDRPKVRMPLQRLENPADVAAYLATFGPARGE